MTLDTPSSTGLRVHATAGDRTAGTPWMTYAAGAVLVLGPLLWAAGMWTSPPASGTSDLDYVRSLGRDLTMTQVSALLLHYGNLLIGLGLLAAPSLVRGPRGRGLTVVGSLLAALGFTNVSGTLLSDWWNASAVTHLPAATAAEVFAGFKDSSLLWPWDGTEMLSLLGPVLLLAGLARAGVLGWWTIAVLVAGVLGMMFIPWDLPHLSAVAILVAFTPFVMIGLRLLRRGWLSRS
ncbi:hypothetical protein [Nocardioides mesophilus]|uniref:DUF4386 family protein n=1 Tax=Nocardioides mesophilus TaxID=433659 RepID=A0A7G9R8U4_9ACTN|nr:hypothetical protein [Nocardioides mesophilus]QNN52019.1 hypothetical protein H9L09_16085 [Nocardioides mesophilus]